MSLTTDFGLADNYVGQMKAVICGLAPEVRTVDLTHEVPAQNVIEGAFQLATAWNVFPEGTVHLVVVDPGVGTRRRGIAWRYGGHFFVMPDNGLGTLALAGDAPEEVVVLDNPAAHRHEVSPTFHGRDIFAPVAARLASGQPLSMLGTATDPASLVRLDLSAVESFPGGVRAPVVSIDHFGNCRTLISAADLTGPPEQMRVRCGRAVVRGIVATFGAVPEGRTLAHFGSHGGLEIAVRGGSAATAWEITRGMMVEVSGGA